MLLPIVAMCEEPASSIFSFAAFGTLGVVHTDQNKADFVATPFEAVGAGYTDSWSAEVDSLIGAQVRADLTPKLSAILQVIAQQNYDASYTPHVEWANLKYEISPDFSVRLGRTAIGLFLVSDTRNVGFSNPWVRVPIELYGLVSVTSNDGIDASYRLEMGEVINTFGATFGSETIRFPNHQSGSSETASAKGQISLVDTVERGFATLRLTYGQAHVTVRTLDPLFDAFRQFGPAGVGIADKYAVDDRIIRFYGVSLGYEPGDWFAMGEWGRVNADSVLGEKTGWYVSSGHRFGKVTPYLTYAQIRPNSNTSDPGLNLSQLPPNQVVPAETLNEQLNAALASLTSQRTLSAGLRWDFLRNMDLKVQYDRVDLGAHSQGWLTNLQPGFRVGSALDVFSATVDFVF